MAPRAKVLAAKPDSLRSILETHMVEKERMDSQLVLWPPCMGHRAHMLTHIN